MTVMVFASGVRARRAVKRLGRHSKLIREHRDVM